MCFHFLYFQDVFFLPQLSESIYLHFYLYLRQPAKRSSHPNLCRSSRCRHCAANANSAGRRFPPSSQAGASPAAVRNSALRNRAASPDARPGALQPLCLRGGVVPPAPRGNDTRTELESLFRETDAQSTQAWRTSLRLSEPAGEHGTLN